METKTKEQIRFELYSYIINKAGDLSKEEHKTIKDLITAYDTAESKKATNAKITLVKGKINHFLGKAKRMAKTPQIEGNIEALNMCLKWLNEDDE